MVLETGDDRARLVTKPTDMMLEIEGAIVQEREMYRLIVFMSRQERRLQCRHLLTGVTCL